MEDYKKFDWEWGKACDYDQKDFSPKFIEYVGKCSSKSPDGRATCNLLTDHSDARQNPVGVIEKSRHVSITGESWDGRPSVKKIMR